MTEFKYIITDEEGIHARPAGELVKACKAFESKITIEKDGKVGDCKKIFALMGMSIKKGAEVTLRFEGADEEAALVSIKKFMETNL